MHREFVRSRLIANWSKLFLAVAYGGETGELLNVVKKEHRDKKDMRERVRQEAADCLFYLCALLDRYDLSFEDCYQASYEKLTDANMKHFNSDS
mgnify:CR=1 FL=1